jgi:TPR repeat protein
MRKAAEQGFPLALTPFGVMFERGQGVPQDNVQAHMWYSLAVANLDVSIAKKEHEIAVRNRDAIAAKMTAAQIEEAQKLAREWTPTRGK